VVGASGQVGEHCLAALRTVGSVAFGTYKQHLRSDLVQVDVTDAAQLDRVLQETRPHIIYFTASLASVDYCELHPDVSYETNVIGVRNAVELANRYRCKLVYMSSEYLFDGAAGPYGECTPANPLSVYGRHKLAAEHYIELFADDWLVIRTAVVYSWESQGKNFLYRLRNSLREGRQISVPTDQISTPTYAPDLVRAMIQLAEQDEHGVFNVCGPRIASRYAYALAAADAFGLDPALIVPVLTTDLNQAALRPLNAGLIVDKVERALHRAMLDFTFGLREMASSAPTS
jgi:dTDP-4-dehydrorhamnose reductase